MRVNFFKSLLETKSLLVKNAIPTLYLLETLITDFYLEFLIYIISLDFYSLIELVIQFWIWSDALG